MQERGGEWKDEPSVLHQELKKRKSEALPERADELSKMVLSISDRGTWLRAERGWGKKGGESRRMLHLRFRNGVDGVVGVDQHLE